jgi:hypothetical protein
MITRPLATREELSSPQVTPTGSIDGIGFAMHGAPKPVLPKVLLFVTQCNNRIYGRGAP